MTSCQEIKNSLNSLKSIASSISYPIIPTTSSIKNKEIFRQLHLNQSLVKFHVKVQRTCL